VSWSIINLNHNCYKILKILYANIRWVLGREFDKTMRFSMKLIVILNLNNLIVAR